MKKSLSRHFICISHTMNLNKLSGIARPVDLSYTTNKLIAILSAVALMGGIIMGLFQGLVVGKVLLLGLQFAATVFLAWAFAREVDPHQQWSAFVVVALVAAGFVWGIRPDLLSIAIVMGASRILICSCGREVKIYDLLMVLGGAAWLVYGQHQGLAVIIIGITILLDGFLAPAHRLSLLFGAIGVAMGASAFYFYPIIPSISMGLINGNLVVLALFIIYLYMAYRRPEAPADSNDLTISRNRLLALHILLLLWVIFALPIHGAGSLNKLFIVWASMAGVSAYGIAAGIFKRKAGNVA